MPKFLDYLENTLDWELQQQSEVGDAAGIDAKRILPKAQAKRVVSECVKYFAKNNQARFQKEFTYIFDHDTTTFDIPEYILKVEAYKDGNKWYMLPGNDDIQATIKRVSSTKIYNSDSWEKGDELVLLVVDKPLDIVNDDDVVKFPDEWLRLLTLEVKRRAYSRKNKAISQYEFAELMELKKDWAKDVGKVRFVSRLAWKGKGYGRRHK